jgi:hypothetical protein
LTGPVSSVFARDDSVACLVSERPGTGVELSARSTTSGIVSLPTTAAIGVVEAKAKDAGLAGDKNKPAFVLNYLIEESIQLLKDRLALEQFHDRALCARGCQCVRSARAAPVT